MIRRNPWKMDNTCRRKTLAPKDITESTIQTCPLHKTRLTVFDPRKLRPAKTQIYESFRLDPVSEIRASLHGKSRPKVSPLRPPSPTHHPLADQRSGKEQCWIQYLPPKGAAWSLSTGSASSIIGGLVDPSPDGSGTASEGTVAGVSTPATSPSTDSIVVTDPSAAVPDPSITTPSSDPSTESIATGSGSPGRTLDFFLLRSSRSCSSSER
nr:hypothetical protein Itr_chr12CG15200 [Ipomoea trifida]